MRKVTFFKILFSLALFLLGNATFAQNKKEPVNLIYDTDIDLDVDDVGALAMLNALEDNGEVNLLGVICNAPTPYGATTISAINLYYGHSNIPVGDMPIEDYVYDKSFSKLYRNYEIETPYGNFNLPIFKRFPNTVKSRKDVWNGVELYRKLLSESPDKSVNIAAVGLLTVLDELLDSKPDKYSKLSGKDLVAKKVNQLVCMAGASQPAPGKHHFNWGFDGRGNAEKITHQWPTEIVIMPHGKTVKTGERLTYETPKDNPVRAAYELFLKPKNLVDRPSWDQMACLYAVRGASTYFSEVGGRRLDVLQNPVTYTWREKQANEPQHIMLKMEASPEEFKKVIEDLMVQPPKKTVGNGVKQKVMLDGYFNNEYTKGANGEKTSWHYRWEDTSNGGFSELGKVFKSKGASLATNSVALSNTTLNGSDIYIIVDPDTKTETDQPNYIKNKDIKIISKWVENGGQLLVLANDSVNCEFEHLNKLMAKFNLNFTQNCLNKVNGKNYDMGLVNTAKNSPLFTSLNSIYMKEVSSITGDENLINVLTTQGKTVMGIVNYGKGKVIAVGDPWLYNEYIDHGHLPEKFENQKAAEELVNYLINK